MIARGGGSIVNIGSSCYHMQEDFFPGYAIAKSGVEGLTRTMARTFGPHNIRMNCVLPGWVATERQLAKWWTPEGEAGTLRDQALKRRIYADEFAQMVLFLAADDGGAYRAELPGRRRKVLTGRSGKLCGSRSRRGCHAARPASRGSGRGSGCPRPR